MALKGLNDESIEFLYDAVLELKDKEEAAKFFEDLCTIKELKDISQRLEVARLLDKNMNYLNLYLMMCLKRYLNCNLMNFFLILEQN